MWGKYGVRSNCSCSPSLCYVCWWVSCLFLVSLSLFSCVLSVEGMVSVEGKSVRGNTMSGLTALISPHSALCVGGFLAYTLLPCR